MTYLQTIILAIIEGLTEFLPISSTGHLIIAEKILGITTTEFTKSFNIIIQLSSITAVIFLYRKKILQSKILWKQTLIAFIPTGVIGLVLYPLIKKYLLDSVTITAIALFLGGLVLLLVDRLHHQHSSNNLSKLKTKNFLSIGLFQSLSVVPGVSRSAASIVGGIFAGLGRVEAVEFSFLLAIPTMIAATGYDLLKTGFSFSSYELTLLVLGSILSFLSSIIAVKSFISFVARNNFTVFALYRLLLAVVVLSFLK